MEPKLSDFGLAKLMGMQESKVFTDVRGTIGYMDPEYMTNAKLTCASDIYSFGIVMLQVLSGQRVIDLDLDARDQLTRKVIIYVPFLSRRFELYQASKLLTYICVCAGKGCEHWKKASYRYSRPSNERRSEQFRLGIDTANSSALRG